MAFCSGCDGGTQCASFRCTGLSWAMAGANSAAGVKVKAAASVRSDRIMRSPPVYLSEPAPRHAARTPDHGRVRIRRVPGSPLAREIGFAFDFGHRETDGVPTVSY